MRTISKITLFLIFLPSCLARGQGIYVPSKTVNSQVNGILRPIAGATITVCAAGNSNVPCAPPLAGVLFKDQALTQPLANPTTTDANGNYPTMALAAGNYTITETAVGFAGFSYQITIPLTGTNLVVGNCVQVTTGGALTTTASSCGTSAGTVTATGSPASGNLAKFSGATSVTNADLTGDVSTSGGTIATLATVATAGTNTKITFNAKGLVTSGAQAQFSDIGGVATAGQLPTLPSFQINGGTSSGIFAVSGGSPSTFGNAVNYTTSGTSGGIPYFSSSTTVSSSTALSAHAVVVGAGASAAPLTIAADTATTHALMATAGDPAFRALAGSDIPAINLAASGNGGVTGTLPTGNLPTGIPVANLANGTSGQCINTSGSSVVWGSCAGTAGVQLVNVNTTSVTVNAAVTTLQGMMTFSFGSAALNSSNKSFRVWAFGNVNAVNTTETVSMELLINGSGGLVGSFVPAVSGVGLTWTLSATCTVTATGATGTVFCSSDWDSTVGGSGPGGGAALLVTPISTSYGSINLTGAVSVQPAVSFTTASASNSGTQTHMVIEQLN